MYVACVLVAPCWILAVELAVMMVVCVHFWQLFLGTATSLPWICNRHFHFIQHIHSLAFLVTKGLLQLLRYVAHASTKNSVSVSSFIPFVCAIFFLLQEIISRVKDQLLWSSLHFNSMAGQLYKWVEDCDAL
jgi:hypothetical protein